MSDPALYGYSTLERRLWLFQDYHLQPDPGEDETGRLLRAEGLPDH